MDTRGSAQQADRIHTEKGGIFYEEDVPAPRTGLRSRAACGLRQQARPDGTRADRANLIARSADALSERHHRHGRGRAGPVPGLGHFGAESPVPRTGGNFVPAGQRRPLPRDRAPDEVVLLEVENSADVQKVVDILQKAVDEGAAESVGTDAAIAAAWKDNASITTDGNYICLAVFMNGVSIPAEFMLP